MNALQLEYNEKRRQYMEREITHEDFYCWLADAIHVSEPMLPCTLDEVRASIDPHLNDIALARWDRMDTIVRRMAVSHGMKSWSLCDTVCVLKSFAKRAARA